MSRTNPFASIVTATAEVPEEPSEAVPKLLAHKPSRAKRNREWEKQHHKVTYWGIPPELNSQVQQLAETLGVPAGELVRAFIERGLQAYEQGDLILQPRLRIGKMTLYPEERRR
ncbi:MAG TPA: hypothetical protein PLQ85_02525 [Anaerolineae bacterium]|nr:hypothetical protein [Anaerolineae bacterium]